MYAQSISTSAQSGRRAATDTAQVLGQFRRAVDMLIGDDVIALVTPEVGNGPYNIVVAALPDDPLTQHVACAWTAKTLHIGSWGVQFDAETRQWNPRPAWNTLNPSPPRLAQLRDIAIRGAHTRAPTDSPFVGLLMGKSFAPVTALGRALSTNDKDAIRESAAAIAGLGPGLTPSGDDFLAGVMLGMRIMNHESANQRIDESKERASCFLPLASCLLSAAAPRTTRLSRAFLHAASQGLADEHWHMLLNALSTGNPVQLERAAQAVIAVGASSGLDMIAGFLWQLKAL